MQRNRAPARELAVSIAGTLHERFVSSRRMPILAGHLIELLPRNARVLDVGAGNGMVDSLILAARRDVSIVGVDVVGRKGAYIHVERYDGTTLPFEDRSFDVVLLIDVLHHTKDPRVLLREAARVAGSIIVKDHTRNGLLAGETLAFMDYVGNGYTDVALPNMFYTRAEWDAIFAELHLRENEGRRKLGLYPWPANLIFERDLHFISFLRPA